jgi:hypothetical protein
MGRLHRMARLHSVTHDPLRPGCTGQRPMLSARMQPTASPTHAACGPGTLPQHTRCHTRRRCIDGAGNGWQQAKWRQATTCDGGKRRCKGSDEALTDARGGLGGARDATTGSSGDALRTEEQRVSYGRCRRGRRRRCCSLPVRRPRARRRGALR